jgi:hypothetical protein
VRIGWRTVQRVFGNSHPKLPALFIEDGNTHAQRAEIDPRHYTHVCFSLTENGRSYRLRILAERPTIAVVRPLYLEVWLPKRSNLPLWQKAAFDE